MLYLQLPDFLSNRINHFAHFQNQMHLKNFFEFLMEPMQEPLHRKVHHPYTNPIQDCKNHLQMCFYNPGPGKASMNSKDLYNRSGRSLHWSMAFPILKPVPMGPGVIQYHNHLHSALLFSDGWQKPKRRSQNQDRECCLLVQPISRFSAKLKWEFVKRSSTHSNISIHQQMEFLLCEVHHPNRKLRRGQHKMG